MQRIVVLGLWIVASVAAEAAAQERITRLSLDEAVSLAMRENPTVRAKEFERQSVAANEITAGLRPNPQATFLSEQHPAGNASIPQYTLSIGQPIELGGKRQRRVDSAKAATRVSTYELADLLRQTIYQVKKSFTDILVARDALALAEDNLKTLDDIERIQRYRVEKGDISELELLRIQVQRFAFERDAMDARQALSAAKIALRVASGPDRIAEQFDVIGDLAYRDVSYTQADLYRKVMEYRPDIRAAEAAREKARADVNLARANAWWDITPQIEYQRIGGDNTIGFGISLPIKIFDRNQGEIARSRADVSRAEAARQAVALQALAEVDTAITSMKSEGDKVKALRDTYLPKARQARDTVDYAYRRGGANLLDFLDAQRTYRETALEYLRALGNFQASLYQLEAAVGGPLEN
ncbi:MAG TPA: TolC family protein [Candidatus Methylomirabilis sp.]|nr:TolC family protein [Candidatus Methylomirabilis sp.]